MKEKEPSFAPTSDILAASMDVVSSCALPAEGIVWQPRAGHWALTVVCKATFVLAPELTTLAPEQEALNEIDNHWDDDPARSLYAPSDLVPLKARVDVLLVGHAFAPRERPLRSLVARMVVGELDKSIEVFCDRSFAIDGQLHEGARFARMPLVYERAAGGPETWNPVGVRSDLQDMYGKRSVPNLQPLGIHVASPSDFILPVGFGPIAPSWPLRRERVGIHAASFSPEQWRTRPLPEGFDASYFNAAPLDQQLQTLRDDERIILEHLHPEHSRLVTSLPGLRPRAIVETQGSAQQELALRADTLWIDNNRSLCTLTWRGQMALEHPQQRGRVLISVQSRASTRLPSRPLPPRPSSSASIIETSPLSTPRANLDEDNTFTGTIEPLAPTLPFASTGASTPSVPTPSAPTPSAPTPSRPAAVPRPAVAPAMPPPTIKPPPLVRSAPTEPGKISPNAAWSAGSSGAGKQGMTIGAAAVAAAAAEPEPSAANDGSALAASNAAAQAMPWNRPRAPSIVEIEPEAKPEPRPSSDLSKNEALRFLWFDPASAKLVRRKPAFREIIVESENQEHDPELDDPALAADSALVEDRREVFVVLTQAPSVDEESLEETLLGAVRDDGRFSPPLVLAAGDLRLPFDELEHLKATVAATKPFATNDERLTSAITEAEAFIQSAADLDVTGMADEMSTRVRDAFAQGKRAELLRNIEAQVERTLVSKRRYQKREVLGGVFLRGLLTLAGARRRAPVYLPESIARELPMAAKFKVRLIAEAHLAVDSYEDHPAALKTLALGWVMKLPQKADAPER